MTLRMNTDHYLSDTLPGKISSFFVKKLLSFVGNISNDVISIMIGSHTGIWQERQGKEKRVKISPNFSRIQSFKHIGHKEKCLYPGSEAKLNIALVCLTLLVNITASTLNFSVIERLPFRSRMSMGKWKMFSFALWNHSFVFMDYSQGLFVIEMINAEIKLNVKSPGNSYFIFQLLLSVTSE